MKKTSLAACVSLLFSCASALWQTGDSNSDGLITGSDFTASESCFAGPASSPGSGCGTFDTDGDGFVTVLDLMNMQQAAAAAACTHRRGLYAGARVATPGILGAQADLQTVTLTLCDEAVNGTLARTVFWTGVGDSVTGGGGKRWFQTGYGRRKNIPINHLNPTGPNTGTSPVTNRYVEVTTDYAGVNEEYYRVLLSAPSAGTHTYACDLDNSFTTNVYTYYDSSIIDVSDDLGGWSGTGTTYSCLGEAGEAESYMPGSVATRAKATNCSVDTAGFAFFVPITIDSRAFPTGNLLALTKFYGYAQNAGTGTSGFEIWDTRH